jgi:hypothetical protein
VFGTPLDQIDGYAEATDFVGKVAEVAGLQISLGGELLGAEIARWFLR